MLALSFDGTIPKFAQNAKKMKVESEELTIYYDMQCPYIYQRIEMVKQYCEINNVPVSLIQVDTLEKAKNLPCKKPRNCLVFSIILVCFIKEFLRQ